MTTCIGRSITLLVLSLVLSRTAMAQPRTLDIYWVDVEGGAATLIDAPLHAPANRFSKKVENHVAAVALHFSTTTSPVSTRRRASHRRWNGIANHVWSIEEIIGLLDRRNEVAA